MNLPVQVTQEKLSEILGGIVLVIMSLKFLLEHFKIF